MRTAPARPVAPLRDIYFPYISTAGVSMKTAKLFRNGDSQAVRLPKEFRFEGDEVLIRRIGDAVVLLPAAKSWDSLVGSLAKFPADFAVERDRATDFEERDIL